MMRTLIKGYWGWLLLYGWLAFILYALWQVF